MKQNPPYLTHATGLPVSDNLNIQTAGPRGPALLQDICFWRRIRSKCNTSSRRVLGCRPLGRAWRQS
jgi:catalase